MKKTHLTHQFVKFIPERLDEGVLYISRQYSTAAHKCCCGCGKEVVTPLNPTDWSLRTDGDSVTLHPSIGNWSFPCRSHYWIRKNKVIWDGPMSQQRIERGRALDRIKKQKYFEMTNRKKVPPPKTQSKVSDHQDHKPGLLYNLWATITRWWNSLK